MLHVQAIYQDITSTNIIREWGFIDVTITTVRALLIRTTKHRYQTTKTCRRTQDNVIFPSCGERMYISLVSHADTRCRDDANKGGHNFRKGLPQIQIKYADVNAKYYQLYPMKIIITISYNKRNENIIRWIAFIPNSI